MNPPFLGILSTTIPLLNWIYFGIGAEIAIFGAMIIQVLIEENDDNKKKTTILITLSTLGLAYFYLACPNIVFFGVASLIFLSVQGLYYAMRKFKESI